MKFKKSLEKNIASIPGWKTNRKIVVFESDDWGSVRTHSKQAYNQLKKIGLNVDAIHYNKYESLESNDDLNLLFNSLTEFKDSNGNSPVFTPMCIMGNPDFDKIKDSNYQNYYFQPLHETIKEYPNHDQLINLWNKGFDEKLFYPALHGREHINVRRYLKILQTHEGKDGMRKSVENKSVGASKYNNIIYPNYLGALHPESMEEVNELHLHLEEAGKLFLDYMGYNPTCFIAPNAEEPKELEKTLNKIGVKYLTRSKRRIYPIGDGTFKKEWNFMGSINESSQLIINRNCFFEPVCFGEQEYITNWVDSCLNEMQIAFFWNKPAVISTHRVNYIGHIEPENREKGIKALRLLLKSMLKKWPEIEFLTTDELGHCISNKNRK
jgi:hypothetical protein